MELIFNNQFCVAAQNEDTQLHQVQPKPHQQQLQFINYSIIDKSKAKFELETNPAKKPRYYNKFDKMLLVS